MYDNFDNTNDDCVHSKIRYSEDTTHNGGNNQMNLDNSILFVDATNERNECDNCGRCYSHRNNLYIHKRFICGKEPQFKCQFCEHRAKLKGNLKKHIASVHQNKL